MATQDEKVQSEFKQGIKQFLVELDACKDEEERIVKVQELIFGITGAARRATEREKAAWQQNMK